MEKKLSISKCKKALELKHRRLEGDRQYELHDEVWGLIVDYDDETERLNRQSNNGMKFNYFDFDQFIEDFRITRES